MVDMTHRLFPKISTIEASKIKMNFNIDNSDFRLMECQNEETMQSYFVVYPAPESRELNPFGAIGRKKVLSADFISNNLILA